MSWSAYRFRGNFWCMVFASVGFQMPTSHTFPRSSPGVAACGTAPQLDRKSPTVCRLSSHIPLCSALRATTLCSAFRAALRSRPRRAGRTTTSQVRSLAKVVRNSESGLWLQRAVSRDTITDPSSLPKVGNARPPSRESRPLAQVHTISASPSWSGRVRRKRGVHRPKPRLV